MQSVRLPLLTAMLLCLLAPLAPAADDPAQFRLTNALLDRFDAIQAESEKMKGADEDEDEDDEDDDDLDDADINAIIKRVEADPKVRQLLARHGVTAREYALAAHAVLHAGAFLAFEAAMDKQGAERLLASYTPVQRANIEVLRQRLAAQEK